MTSRSRLDEFCAFRQSYYVPSQQKRRPSASTPLTPQFLAWLAHKSQIDSSLSELRHHISESQRILESTAYRMPVISFSPNDCADPLADLESVILPKLGTCRALIDTLPSDTQLERSVKAAMAGRLAVLAECYKQVQAIHLTRLELRRSIAPTAVPIGMKDGGWRDGGWKDAAKSKSRMMEEGRSPDMLLLASQTKQHALEEEAMDTEEVMIKEEALLASDSINRALLDERTALLTRISADMRQVGDIMQHMSALVRGQGEQIGRIDDALETTEGLTGRAKGEMERRARRQERRHRRVVIGSLLLVIVVLMMVIAAK